MIEESNAAPQQVCKQGLRKQLQGNPHQLAGCGPGQVPRMYWRQSTKPAAISSN